VGEVFIQILSKAVISPRVPDFRSLFGTTGTLGSQSANITIQIVGSYNLPFVVDDDRSRVSVEVRLLEEGIEVAGMAAAEEDSGSEGFLVGQTRAVSPSKYGGDSVMWGEAVDIDIPEPSSRYSGALSFVLMSEMVAGLRQEEGRGGEEEGGGDDGHDGDKGEDNDDVVSPATPICQRKIPLAPLITTPGPHQLVLECEPEGMLLISVEIFLGNPRNIVGHGVLDLSQHKIEWPEGEEPPHGSMAYMQLMSSTEARAMTSTIPSEDSHPIPFVYWSCERQRPPLCPEIPTQYITLGGKCSEDSVCWPSRMRFQLPTEKPRQKDSTAEQDDWVLVMRFLLAPPNLDIETTSKTHIIHAGIYAYGLLPLPPLRGMVGKACNLQAMIALRTSIPLGGNDVTERRPMNVVYTSTANALLSTRRKGHIPQAEQKQLGMELDSDTAWEKVDIGALMNGDADDR